MGILGLVVEDPQSKYYVVVDDAATGHSPYTNEILVGTFGKGSLAAPSYLDFSSSSSISPWGIAESSNPNILYFANYDAANTALNGIWQINVNTGAASPVAVGTAAAGPWIWLSTSKTAWAFSPATITGHRNWRWAICHRKSAGSGDVFLG